MRNLTEVVSECFIWGVGITQPRPGQERRAASYITSTLAATIVIAAAFFLFLVGRL